MLLAALPLVAHAQSVPVEPVNWRYDEDWSVLRGKDPTTLPDWAPAKYQPLTPDGSVWLSTGVEARARYEGYRDNEWGGAAAPDDGALWLRLMPHADLHAGRLRGFVQGIAGYAVGLGTPPGPVDRTGIDLLQGFGEATLPLGRASLTLRAGRELVSLGSERLVGIRYGPNIPQPFDGLRAIADVGKARVQLLRLRPVAIGPGDFDDRTSDTRRLSGLYASSTGFDAYLLDYRNDSARFDQGRGAEHRRTWGLRASGKAGRWGWNWEAMLQRGRFAGAPIRAWSLGTETRYTAGRLRMTMRANIVSGDSDPADPRLQTFDPMFPKGKYFGELSPIGPYNIVNLHPSLEFDLGHGVTLGMAAIAYWRESRGDGLYGLAGQLLRSGRGCDARHIGNQGELLIGWQPSPLLGFTASYSLFGPGRFLRQSGQARPIHMIGLEAMFRL